MCVFLDFFDCSMRCYSFFTSVASLSLSGLSWMEQRPARSRCFNVFFVFEHLIYSSATLNISDKLNGCQRIVEAKFTKAVYNF